MSVLSMTEQDLRMAEVIEQERPRLRNFIRRRVPDESDVEDLLQEVFYELVEANRLLKPIDYVTGWLYRVARNRITDLFRKKKPETFADITVIGEDGTALLIEDLLESSDGGPDAIYMRNLIFDAMDAALAELPREQRDVYIANELEGRSFKELSKQSGVNVNTLLARKRYAVLHLRERLQGIYDEMIGK